jgi:hypothetical protein
VARHLQMRGLARIDLGDLGGIADMRQALDLSLRLGLGFETATAYNNLGEVVGVYEDLHSGLELNTASLEFARRRGMTHHEMWTRSARLWPLMELGEWDELLAEADDILRWDRSQGGTQIEVNVLLCSAPVRAHRGQLVEAHAEVGLSLPRAREIGDLQALAPALSQAAFVYAIAGELAAAIPLTEEFEILTRDSPHRRAGGLAQLVAVCVAAGELALAERLLDTSRPVAGQGNLTAATTGRAMVAEARGEVGHATALYRDAVDGWRRWGSVVGLGYSLLGLGRCGDADAAREGRAIFERLRATPSTLTAKAA